MSARRPRSLRSAFLAIVLSIAATAMVIQSAGAFGLLEAIIGRTVVQTIGVRIQEREDRADVNKRRNARLAELAAEEAMLAVKDRNGWLTPAQVALEQERITLRREAVQEIARRERQIVSYQARRRIDAKLKSTFRDALSVVTGADPRIVDFVMGLARGEKLVVAALDAALADPVADPRESFRELADQLADVRSAVSALGGAETIAVRERLDALIRESIGIAEADGPPPDDQIERLRGISEQADRAGGTFRKAIDELLPKSPGIDMDRFSHDQEWWLWNQLVKETEANDFKQAVSASVMRRAAERAEVIAAEASVSLSDDAIKASALDALRRWIALRRATAGQIDVVVDLDTLVRDAINETLVANGAPPLPERGETIVEPVRRRFMGAGAFAHDYTHRSGAQCSVTVTIENDLLLEPDGTATLQLSDGPSHLVSEDGQEVRCVPAGTGQIYSGTWIPSGSNSVATITFGSTEEVILVEISGDIPTGTATAAFVFPEHRIYGTYRLDFELPEFE